MRACIAAFRRFGDSPEGDALGAVALFAALFGGLMRVGGL